MKKKVFSLLLVLILLPSLFLACTSKDMAGQCGADLRWSYSDKNGTLTITGSGPMFDYTYPQPWASVSDRITALSLPQGLTHIGSYAFYRCTNLRSVAIPDSVLSIGDHAFSDCTELSSVSLPDSIASMGRGVFDGCSKLIVPVQNPPAQTAQVEVSVQTETPQITSVPATPAADNRCGADLSWTFSSATGTLTVTGSGDMYDFDWDGAPWASVRDRITAVSLPNGLTGIGKDAFSDCIHLTSVAIPSSVTVIERNAFKGCSTLTSISIPNSVTSIGAYAFSDCDRLTYVALPRGISAIEDSLFYGCSALTNITIPDTVTDIGKDAFRGCLSLTSVSIPKGVTSIPQMAFSDCSRLTSVSIPSRVTSIGEYAFYGCERLETVSLPKSLKSIGWSAFGDCPALRTAYYSGRAEQRAKINFDGSNDALEDASWRYSTVAGLSITKEPVDVVVRNGELASFAVRTSGKVDSCQWYYRTSSKGKWIAMENGTTAVLTFIAKPAYDGYQYVCDIENENGVLTTDVVTLTMELYPPTIDVQPNDVTVNSGETAAFTVKATDADGYQWYYRTGPKAKWTKTSSGTKATQTVNAKYSHNGYQYYCEVRNDDGKVSTNVVTLTVIPKPPVITVQPKNVTVNSGEAATFTVAVSGADSYQWYYRTTPTGNWTKVKNNSTKTTLTVATKAYHNGYQYRCEVKNADGRATSDFATLTVHAHPPIITVQPKDVSVSVGEDAVFKVTTQYGQTFQWYYRKTTKDSWTKVKNNGTGATLTVTTKAYHNGYQYRCEVTNPDGSATSDIVTLTVK